MVNGPVLFFLASPPSSVGFHPRKLLLRAASHVPITRGEHHVSAQQCLLHAAPCLCKYTRSVQEKFLGTTCVMERVGGMPCSTLKVPRVCVMKGTSDTQVGGNQRYWGVRPKKKKDRAVDMNTHKGATWPHVWPNSAPASQASLRHAIVTQPVAPTIRARRAQDLRPLRTAYHGRAANITRHASFRG